MDSFVLLVGLVGAALLPLTLVRAVVKGMKGEKASGYIIWSGILSCMVFFALSSVVVLASQAVINCSRLF